jgi:signal transduction histidine kinase
VIRFKSIFTRIIFLHVIAIGATSICMPIVLYWLLVRETSSLHYDAMRAQASTLTTNLTLRGDQIALDLPRELDGLYSEAYGRYAYAVLDGAGKVLFSSLGDRSPIFPEDTRAANVALLETHREDALISGVSVPYDIGGRRLWVQVAENLAHRDVIIDDIVADFLQRVGWITLPILLLLLAFDIVIFRGALRPVLAASRQAREISPKRTDVRLPVNDLPAEILPLVQAVNQALDRLENGFRAQREFTADAAHELRTPLAILRTRIDTLDDQQVATTLRQDIAGMSRIVGQLLDIAEVETFVVDPSEKLDLHEVCVEVAEFIAPLAIMHGKSITLSGATEPVWIRGNKEMVWRALRNLVENAVSHTRENTAVEIVVEKNGGVCVRDEGPGVPESERELVFQRFWRRDRRHAGSAGLGLSIVRRIVDAHHASMALGNRPAGGAEFSLRFARAD